MPGPSTPRHGERGAKSGMGASAWPGCTSLADGACQHVTIGGDMRDFFGLVAAGPFFFVSAWLLMIFAGIVSTDVGIRPFGYVTSMVVTIALWLALAPAIGAIRRGGTKKG